MMKDNIEISEYNGAGYAPVMNFGEWRVALLNYAPRFDRENLKELERHLLTDEVFVLLEGNAVLIVGEKIHEYNMEKNKIYNIKAGEWHHIIVSRDAKVLIVENHNTSKDNTEYLIL